MSPSENELSKIVAEYLSAIRGAQLDDASDVLPYWDVIAFQTRCIAAIERATGRSSVYFERVNRPKEKHIGEYDHLEVQIGVVKSLLHDIQNGYTKSQEELIHGSLFSDFLEMAAHLLDNHYKDAAAVITGSTLEAHLRQLGSKESVPLDAPNGKPKTADLLNADLAAVGAYSKVDQKNITAWLGLRNDAAHGNYAAYDEARVRLFIENVRFFITKHPA